MLWQKARIINSDKFPKIVGKELWVVVGAPVVMATRDMTTNARIEPSPVLRASLIDERDGFPLYVSSDRIELLGGSDAFAEDVSCTPVEAFIRGEP